MDTIFTLPLFILACCQALLTALHLVPGLGLHVSKAIKSLRSNTASQTVIYTVAAALGLLSVSSLYELSKGADRIRSGNLRGEVMATVDYLRAQVSCALSLSNLLVLLLNVVLSSKRCTLDSTQKNLTAMKRQVTGLQAEYQRVTAAAGGDHGPVAAAAATAVVAEAAALKKTVDKLIAEKLQLQSELEEAEKAAKSSEARVTAMVSQMKGFDQEFDRLLDENKTLKAQMQQQQSAPAAGGGLFTALSGSLTGPSGSHKKDD